MIKTLIEFLKESKDASKERLKLSIVPIYLTILVLCYWKPISIYLFSRKSIEEKIKSIDSIYLGENHYSHLWNLLYVLLVSLVSSLIFPLLMLGIDFILKKPNNERKIIKNNLKDTDRNEELKITKHKYEINKILSGNKEVEDYNKSIEELKKSYEDRIINLESINNQKDKNFSKQIEIITKENNQLQTEITEILDLNNQLKNRNDSLKINEFELTNFSKFNMIFEKKEFFIEYIYNIEPVSEDIMFIKSLLSQLIEFNLHSLLNRIAINIYNRSENINLNIRTKQYSKEKKFIENNNLGELISKSDLIETYFIGKSHSILEELISYIEDFINNSNDEEFDYNE